MAGNDALLVHHVGHAVSAQIDAADYVVQQVILIDAHQVEGGLAVLLYRYPHYNAQLALEDRRGVKRQVICLLQKGEEAAAQLLRCAVDSLYQPPVQVIQGGRIEFVGLRRFLQNLAAVCPGCGGVRTGLLPIRAGGHHRLHRVVVGQGHHAVGQHMDVGLHCLGRLPGHGLKAVQQDAVGQ